MTRYLQVQPQGIPRWLGEPARTPAHQVFWGLLQMRDDVPLNPAALADRMGLPVADFARALFELNRSQALRVNTEANTHGDQYRYDHAQLCEDLCALGAHSTPLLLAGEDGLCLAQQGLPDEVSSEQAAVCHGGGTQVFPHVVPLHLGNTTVRLCSTRAIDMAGAAMLRLVRRLIGLQQLAQA